ncbi:hypothetical protein ABB31_17495 [Stenotrophomonas pavanii]|nr:hypothetical protein ABB31_17495 [Stenotrophomonas pavanii]
MAAFHPGCSKRGDALAVLGVAQNLQFPGQRIHLDLAVMRTARADQVACHHVVGEGCRVGRLAFGKAIRQPGGTVGIECITGEVVVMRSDLRKRAAQRVAGDVYRTIPILFSQIDCLLGECEGIAELCVDSCGDHCSVDAAINQRLAIELGTAMGDDYFFGFEIMVNDALVAGGGV